METTREILKKESLILAEEMEAELSSNGRFPTLKRQYLRGSLKWLVNKTIELRDKEWKRNIRRLVVENPGIFDDGLPAQSLSKLLKDSL